MEKEVVFQIEVLNWSKINPNRKDQKTYTWFKFKHDFFINQKMMVLTHIEKLFWVFILCESSKQNCNEVKRFANVSTTTLQRLATIDERSAHDALKNLQKLQLLRFRTLRARYEHEPLYKNRIDKNRIEHISKTDFDITDVVDKEKTKNSWLVDLWNEHCESLPKVTKETPSRRKRINSRLAAEPDREKWLLAIKKIAASDFCCGKSGTKEGIRPWVANFDWLIRSDDTIVKVLEGLYDNKKVSQKKHEFGPRKEWDMGI